MAGITKAIASLPSAGGSTEPKIAALRELNAAITKYLALVDAKPESATQAKPLNRNVFRFEDLPPEIRNIIYGYALVPESSITIGRHVNKAATNYKRNKHFKKTGKHLVKARCVYELRCMVRKTIGRQARVFKYGAVQTATLLRVSKGIRSEARPLLYGHNKFVFKSTSAFWDFYHDIKTAVHLFQSIDLRDIPNGPIGVFTYSSKLSRFAIKTMYGHLYSQVVDGIRKMVLTCGCKACARTAPVHDPCPHKPFCLAKSVAEQQRRLKAVSIYSDWPDLHLRDAFKDFPSNKRVTIEDIETVLRVHYEKSRRRF